MVYVDALVALFAFGGLYATGIFGWSTVQIGAFGILLTVAGTAGAIIGGKLDDSFGPKPVVMTALIVLLLAAIGILSLSADRALFFIPLTPPQPNGGLFAATGERLYLAFGLVIGAVAGALQAASRTLLVRLAEPSQMTEAFGLYALSGKMTSFLCPLAVGVLTAWSGSQRVGMSVLVVFFAAGAALMVPLRMDD
jgi:UMF1 family MFS transporter